MVKSRANLESWSALYALVAAIVACGPRPGTDAVEASSSSSGSPECSDVEDPLPLLIGSCLDPLCVEWNEDPWGPLPASSVTWSTSCVVAALGRSADGSPATRLDSCTVPPVSGEAPAGILVMLGREIDAEVGDEIAVEYRSTRDDLSWTWRGWMLRDRNGRLLAARSKGRPPPAEAFDADALFVSQRDCPGKPDYCGSTVHNGAIHLEVGDASISVAKGERGVLALAIGEWEVAAPTVTIVENASCGGYSDYVHVDFGIIARPSP